MPEPVAPQPPRRRVAVAAALAVVVAAGLLSRRYPLPGVFAEHTGDALYATAAYVGFALIAPGARTARLFAAAWAFATLVEFGQLLSWPWLNDLRQTVPGALLLGQGFLWADLVAYPLGAALAAGFDAIVRSRRRRAP